MKQIYQIIIIFPIFVNALYYLFNDFLILNNELKE